MNQSSNLHEIYGQIFILILLLFLLFLKKKSFKDSINNLGNLNRIYKSHSQYLIGSVLVLLLITGYLAHGLFIAFYLLTPIYISCIYILFRKDEKLESWYFILKGSFYFLLALLIFLSLNRDLAQFINSVFIEDLSINSSGATISLAIIEGVSAIVNGRDKLTKYKQKE